MGTPIDTRRLGRGGQGSRALSLLWPVVGGLLVLLGAFRLSVSGGGAAVLSGVLAVVAAFVIMRRPALGILIYMTTFLFTYPSFLRGAGNFTINNVLGLVLLPIMLYGMLREGNGWLIRYKPIVIIGAIVTLMIGSGVFYRPSVEVSSRLEERVAVSTRAQGPALIATRAPAAKFLTRFVFLTFFVFFIRTPRDVKMCVGVIIACLLMTYLSVSAEAGPFGWGAGRLRVIGASGAAVYAGRNPNKLAYFALFGLTLLWYSRRAIRQPIVYPFWFIASAIAFIMIPLTGSRSGILNLMFFIAIVLMEGRFNYRKIVGLSLITGAMIIQFGYNTSVVEVLFPGELGERLTRFDIRPEVLTEGVEASGSAEGRVLTAQAALRVWAHNPLSGVGIGNFEMERVATDPYGTRGPPHNSYLWSLAEGGIIVFTLYGLLYFWVFRQLRRIEWEYEARFGELGLGWLVNAMRTAMIGFLIFSFFADMWHHVMFYIIMGLTLSVIRLHQVYAETGEVPGPFTIGAPMRPASG